MFSASCTVRLSRAQRLSLLGRRAVHVTRVARSTNRNRLSRAALDAWAEGPQVLAHAHTRHAAEPHALSRLRLLGEGMTPASGWAVRMVSAAGMKGGPSPNQDACSFTRFHSGWVVCVVCDGHGEEGELLSEQLTRTLPMFIGEELTCRQPTEALKTAFLRAQEDLEQDRKFKKIQVHSGSTAVAMLSAEDSSGAWVAHAGDSKLVLCDLAAGVPTFFTDDHKAHDPSENKRLEDAGAQVIQKRYEDGDVVSRIFVPRTGVPGLAMSRSLGDGCLKSYGVIAEPEVHEITDELASCQAPLVVLATDGLWDAIAVDDTVAALSTRYRSRLDVGLGAEALTRRAQRLWIECEGDYCDDTSIVLFGPEQSFVPS